MVHHTSKYIEVFVSSMKMHLLGLSEMELDLFDSIIRRFKEIDDFLSASEALPW